MLTKVRYSAAEVLRWTRYEILMYLAYAAVIALLFSVVNLSFLRLPWAPVAVVGTAVAFIVGFQNNAAYGRIWEARKIWGGIVNASRVWGIFVQSHVNGDESSGEVSEEELAQHRSALIHRHIAWMTCLRYAMRQSKPWETFDQCPANVEWTSTMNIPEREESLEDALGGVLSEEERQRVLSRSNPPSAVLFEQSQHLKALRDRGLLGKFAHLQLLEKLDGLLQLQGKSERIKNFPYPRQYATVGFQFVRLFNILIPFAALPQFASIGSALKGQWPVAGRLFIWVGVPFCALVSWLFHVMERIGGAGENPFEGTANDVPISTISRAIEIDLRQLLDEAPANIPDPLESRRDVQM